MEEEATRVAQGEVQEVDPILVPQKDALPASINAIFSPPPNFIVESTTSSNIELEAGIHLKNGGLEHGIPESMDIDDLSPGGKIHGEVIIHDSDSDEGVGADIGMIKEERTSPLRSALTPTEEEVDAVLAELDSLPDGACETGDIDEEEDDEGWAYYKMEPQNEMQQEDVIVRGPSDVTSETITCEIQESLSSRPIVIQNTQKSPSGSPTMSGSPRTVEGFITSVELNTPEESFNTNLSINQSTEYFNGGQVDQNSGPFSVYVSSSPEPASMETPPVQSQSALHDFSGFGSELQPELKFSELSDTAESPSVEIVHAQSTVEVLATPSPVEAPSPYHEHPMLVTDIMSQSITGDLPFEPYQPYLPSPEVALNLEAGSSAFDNFEETTKNFNDLVTEANEYGNYFEKIESSSVEATAHVTSFNERSSVLIDEREIREEASDLRNVIEPTISEESSNLIEQLESTTNVVEQIISSNTTEGIETVFYNQEDDLAGTPLLSTEPTQQFYYEKDRFSNEVAKAFDAPLDEMMMSYHEDQNPLMENSTPSHDYLIEVNHLSPVTEDIPSVDSQIETLTAEVSNLDIACEQELHEPETIVSEVDIPCEVPLDSAISSSVEVTKPTTAPRTPKAAPPKPSPRSVGTKLTTKATPSTEPAAARSAPKRPATSSAQKALPKSTAPKPSSAPLIARSRLSTSATTTSSTRASSATTRNVTTKLTSTAPSRSKSTNTTTTTRTTAAPPSAAKTKSTTSTTTRTSVLAPKTRPANPTTVPSKSPSVSKPHTMTSSTSRTTTSKMSNGVATKTTTTTSRLSTSGLTKPPTSTLDKKSSTSTIASKTTTSMASRKPVTTTTKTTATTAIKKAPTSAVSSKDSKNNTNRLLSTSKPASVLLASKTTATKTTSLGMKAPVASKTRTVPLKTTKMTGLKGKKPEEPTSQKVASADDSLLVNGENKIIDEETSVEVKEKVDDVNLIEIMERDDSAEKEAIVAAEMNQEILVNGGDH